ncbi:MAG: hypothetical protein JRJ64_08350 [Deltaproteobacteria bacterium]|nr:hypothetical protein [Deltaproteobacteria bacterium]
MSALQSSVAPWRTGDEGGDRTPARRVPEPQQSTEGTPRQPVEVPGRSGRAGYEIAKEAVMCPTCAQEHLAKEAAQEAESLGI